MAKKKKDTKMQPGVIKAKRTTKDSVFVDLFTNKKYLLELYKTLHPEDTDVTEDDLDIVTIENILTDALYNDLGFMVHGKQFLILVEAQTTWSENVLLISRDFFGVKKAPIEVEAVVIFGGRKKNIIMWKFCSLSSCLTPFALTNLTERPTH